MHKLDVLLMATDFSKTMHLEASDEQTLNQVATDLFKCFYNERFFLPNESPENQNAPIHLRVCTVQQNTEDLRNAVNVFVHKYNKTIPKINELNSFLKRLPDNSKFLFLNPNDLKDQMDSVKHKEYIAALNGAIPDYETAVKNTTELFGDILKIYHIYVADNDRDSIHRIGETEADNKKCRFCGNTKDTGARFKKKAHVISEALGNKHIISMEECDDCNEYFGKTIESDIINYLQTFSVIYGVLNKKNEIPTLLGSNFALKNMGGNNLAIFLTDPNDSKPFTKEQLDKLLTDVSEGKVPTEKTTGNEGKTISDKINENLYEDNDNGNNPSFEFPLHFNQNIIKQNIYKALVKFALEIIPNKDFDNEKFSKTIAWVRGTKFEKKLPKISIIQTYLMFSKQPKIITFLRKNDDNTLPYAVGMFQYTLFTFSFIIPVFDEKIAADFLDDNTYEHYWNTFKHLSKAPDSRFEDFSSFVPAKLNVNFKFEKRSETR